MHTNWDNKNVQPLLPEFELFMSLLMIDQCQPSTTKFLVHRKLTFSPVLDYYFLVFVSSFPSLQLALNVQYEKLLGTIISSNVSRQTHLYVTPPYLSEWANYRDDGPQNSSPEEKSFGEEPSVFCPTNF